MGCGGSRPEVIEGQDASSSAACLKPPQLHRKAAGDIAIPAPAGGVVPVSAPPPRPAPAVVATAVPNPKPIKPNDRVNSDKPIKDLVRLLYHRPYHGYYSVRKIRR